MITILHGDNTKTLEQRLMSVVAEEIPGSNCIRLSVERSIQGRDKIFCCFNHGKQSHRIRCEFDPLDMQSSHDSVLRQRLRIIASDVLD